MKRATVRDLRYHFSEVENLLQEGEEIEITKHKRVIAHLLPAKIRTRPKQPDFLERLKKIFGKKRLKVSGAKLLANERNRY